MLGEDALLVEAGARAALVDGVAEQPRRPPELVERRQRTEALQEEQDRTSVSVKLSPCGAQPGMLITESPKALR
jgi:hypothetical protein